MTSKNTAISRTKASLPARWLFRNHVAVHAVDKVLDYGCGRGLDADVYGMDKYDPNYQPDMPDGEYDAILCTYVFNVLNTAERAEAAYYLVGLLNGNFASVFITVRRDLPPEGKQTRHGYQYNVVLPFHVVRETSTYCIYGANAAMLSKYIYDMTA